MNYGEFLRIRNVLGKTQKEVAHLLGVSLKAVTSYEQGWREVPPHVERQMFFLLAGKIGLPKRNCWTVNRCPNSRKKNCPAFTLTSGKYCWFINGTNCQGVAQKSWDDKMTICRACVVFEPLLAEVG